MLFLFLLFNFVFQISNLDWKRVSLLSLNQDNYLKINLEVSKVNV